MTQKERRQKIYDELKGFNGSINKVAVKSGFHRNTVRRVLNHLGEENNDKIWIAAAEVLILLKKEKQKEQQTFEKLATAAQAIIL